MELDLAQLSALRAAVDTGTLDAAAKQLHVTPSAVSQRLKALEQSTGQVLLVRSRPVRITEAGRSLLRLARQLDLLVSEAVREIAPEAGGPAVLPVAVNADSLSTWFLPALASLRDEDVQLDLHRADQDVTAALLREGAVLAAVTGAAKPVPGCTSTPLGVMRYRPAATAAFVERWFPDGVSASALSRAPVVRYDADDDLQDSWLRRRARGRLAPPGHRIPSTEGFVNAVLAGLGWGMISELQLAAQALSAAVVLLDASAVVDSHLYWQRWKIGSEQLDRLSDLVVTAARQNLLQA
jgi:LysR family transcriptional regulator (chromosome initiation inhibitor)